MKKIFIIILSLILVLSSAFCVFAERRDDLPMVVDNADMFTADEEAYLAQLAEKLYRDCGYDVLVLTEPDNHGFSEYYGYIDYFWENSGYGSDEEGSGICLYICMEPGRRFWYTEATGEACAYVNYDVVNYVDDAMNYYMQNGDFTGAAEQWFKGYTSVFADEPGKKDDPYDPYYPYDPEPAPERSDAEKLKMALGIGAVLAVIAGGINLSIGYFGMHSVGIAENADKYELGGSMKLERCRDILLNVSIQRIPIENNNNSGGHSGGSSFSVHSSGGFSHSGGGGRSF